jgi:2-haloacid dehalogenase
MPEPAAVVFDLGGVLIDWDPRHLYRALFVDDEEGMEWFLANVTTPAWNAEQDRGRSWDDAVAELIERHPEHEELIRAFRERWLEMLGGAHEDTVEVLAEVRSGGVPVYALTNWSADTFELARESFPFLGWFRGVLVSGREKLAKPDTRIFRLLLERFSLVPESTVFIDDSPANVAAAQALGIDAIQFRGASELRAELRARGVLE